MIDVSDIVAIFTLLATLVTIYLAWRIPHQVMVNQCYSDLVANYNSYEMGEAIRTIFDFYKYCCGGKFDNIEKCYERRYYTDFPERAKNYTPECPHLAEDPEQKNCLCCSRYKNESKPEYKDTLHARRRLVDQYFWFIGDLVFGKDYLVHLPKYVLRHWFTKSEHKLLAIILKMNEAEEEIRAQEKEDEIPEQNYSANTGLMWTIRKRLYAESKHWR